MSGGPFTASTRRYGGAIKDYYEELWQRLPDERAVPDFDRRRSFLLGELRTGDRVLDLGCGDGVFAEVLAGAGAPVVAVDVAEAALRRARRRLPALDVRLAPIDGKLPLEDNAFELVWASEVIEHIADTAQWLSEVRRVLAPSGRLLLTTPSHDRLPVALYGIDRFSEPLGDHLHLYTRGSLLGVLREFGFDPVTVRTAGGPPLLRRSLHARAVR
jgi:2-polyprenyl-3-methyl-5-hydroxy-6-metoxy-1,4-benzoquinol methylase